MATKATRSRAPAKRPPSRATLARLHISPEVGWYLHSRGIPLPDCPPAIKTPEGGARRGARFDPARVDRVLDVFSRLRHTQGKWAGQPLRPDPWQIAYILAPVFGWVYRNEDGDWVRVARRVYVDVPRKNGKTTLSGGFATYLTCADHEQGAQVYAVASGRDQARYCFDPVRQLAQKSPALSPYVKALAHRIIHQPTGSYFAVVSKLADVLHGANVYGAIIDELHVHKTPDLVEAVETGTGSRSQPLVFTITTADDGRSTTIYARRRHYVEQIARGALKDTSMYGVVWAADAEDDPFAESTWKKANPGFGVSPSKSYLENAANEARNSPADLAKFLRLHLGIRTRQQTRYLDLEAWDRNASIVDERKLAGRIAYGGLDLASTSDLCALAWVFPDGNGGHDLLWRLWCPEGALEAIDRRTAGQARVWVDRGLLVATPSDVADYDYIRTQINLDREKFRVREIAYDPWNSSQLVSDLLGDGAPLVKMRQGFGSMSAPTKEFQRLALEGTAETPRLRHGGNPAIRWQVDNLAVEMDAAGNVKPSKRNSGDKIDGVVALIMGLDRAVHYTPPRRSVYDDGDLEIV
ncbi:terminase large subunit [Amycolatopsis vastitatis]|uniref:Terminase n=1 Tax=Amycolatopsis vastitatis TaxID=1905142 RepID=A0A229TEP6_9PSEU|nr:terminase TerL endonuclease subunit [Amycolatopsis vastitatis]OXM69638.1 terminase [Amycolatopsis vastitatis]